MFPTLLFFGVLQNWSSAAQSRFSNSSLDYRSRRPLSNDREPGDVGDRSGKLINTQDLILSSIAHRRIEHSDSSRVSTADSSDKLEYSDRSLRRRLDDLGDFNELLKTAVVPLPDVYTTTLGIKIWATNILCYNTRIDALTIGYNQVNTKKFEFDVDIYGLDTICDFDWMYRMTAIIPIKGVGTGRAFSTSNDPNAKVAFTSEDFSLNPPNSSSITECNANIEIDYIELEGGIVSRFVESIQGSLLETLEASINDAACKELGPLVANLLSDMTAILELFLGSSLDKNSTALEDAQNAENNLVIPKDIQPVDLFSSWGKNNGTLVQQALWNLDELIGTAIEDSTKSTGTGEDLVINELLRSLLLDVHGSLVIDASGLPESISTEFSILQGGDMVFPEATIVLNEVKITGLDSLLAFDPLGRFGNHTLMSHLHWNYIEIEFNLDVKMTPSTNSAFNITENINVQFGIENLDVEVYLMIAFDESYLENIQLGKLFNMAELVNCLLADLLTIEITALSVSIDDISPPNLKGFFSPTLDLVIGNAIKGVFEMYEDSLLHVLPNLFQTSIKGLLNNQLMVPSDTCLPILVSSLNSGYVNLPDLLLAPERAVEVGGSGASPYGSFIPLAVNFVKDGVSDINPKDGTSEVNDLLISPITKWQSGVAGFLKFPENVFNLNQILSIDKFKAKLVFRGSKVEIENLNSIGSPIDLVQPTSPLTLNTNFGMGISPKPLRFSMQLMFELMNDDINLSNHIDISMDIFNTTVNAGTLLALSEAGFMRFPIRYMSNPDCWLSLIQVPNLNSKGVRSKRSNKTLGLEYLDISPTKIRLNVSCLSCSSPDFFESFSLTTPKNEEDLTHEITRLFDYISEILSGKFLQVQLDRMRSSAKLSCPFNLTGLPYQTPQASQLSFDTPEKLAGHISSLVAIFVTLIFIVLAAVIIRLKFNRIQYKRHTQWVETLATDEFEFFLRKQVIMEDKQRKLNTYSTSLMKSPSVPLVVRVLIPFVILGNIALFMIGHLSLGASVNFSGLLAGQTFEVDDFFTFSIAKSTIDLWNAGAKGLATLLFLFSGLWPYVKQFTTLYLWLTPPRRVPVTYRESIFIRLDALGKWSFVDIFVLIISIVSFRVSVNSPVFSFLPEEFYALNLVVVPKLGLYANMTAQIVSQLNSHLIIYYHRKVKEVVLLQIEQEVETLSDNIICTEGNECEKTRTLYEHDFARVGSEKRHVLTLRPAAIYGIMLLALIIVSLIICGCGMKTFSLEVFGLVGIAVEAGLDGQKAYTSHNLYSLVQLLAKQASYLDTASDYWGLGVLSTVLIFTILIVPLVQVLLVMIRWFVPLDERWRLRNIAAMEALGAWQYIDVYIFAVIISSWQIGAVSEFMINDYCDSLKHIFASAVYYDILSEYDAQCFQTSIQVKAGTWVLFVASLMLVLLKHSVGKAALQQEQEYRKISFSIKKVSDENSEIINEEKDMAAATSLVTPSPLFTDYYRWCIRT